VLASIIASDAALLTAFNRAIDNVLQNNSKARANPKALSMLDGYKRPLVNSLASNLQRYGFGKVAHVETLAEIIEQMSEENGGDSHQEAPGTSGKTPGDVQ
jgi:hypothetical protein